MAWQNEMVEILRIMINDMCPTYKFSDLTLEKVIVASAQYVITEADALSFNQDYIPDIMAVSITPDPTDRDGGTRDDDFINLTLLKAGCFIDNCNAREAARKGGISIREWNTSIDTKGLFAAANAIMQNGWCKNYGDTLYGLLSGNASVGVGIMGPFRTIYSAYNTSTGYGFSDGGSLFGGLNDRR